MTQVVNYHYVSCSFSCCLCIFPPFSLFFFNHPATTVLYPLSLHDALPIFRVQKEPAMRAAPLSTAAHRRRPASNAPNPPTARSEEHTSELQSRGHLVCRLLLEKKKTTVLTVRRAAYQK